MLHKSTGRAIACAILAAVFAACSGGNTAVPSFQRNSTGHGSSSHRVWHVNGFTGSFTEYTLPTGVSPQRLTRAPDQGAWFIGGSLVGRITDNGTVTLYPKPADYFAGPGDLIATKAGAAFTILVNNQLNLLDDLVRIGPGGKVSVSPLGSPNNSDEQFTDLAVDPSGQFWTAFCVESCGEFPHSIIEPPGIVLVSPDLIAYVIAFGRDGDAYITAHNGFYYSVLSYVVKVRLGQTTPQFFPLPGNSLPLGITVGPDGKIWVVEPGTNQIARMTPFGVVTQFSIPTPNSGAAFITAAGDGALWFTESNANKLGRITTKGTITEYPVPTANAGVFGIASNASTAPHGIVWFSESKAGKIGKFEF